MRRKAQEESNAMKAAARERLLVVCGGGGGAGRVHGAYASLTLDGTPGFGVQCGSGGSVSTMFESTISDLNFRNLGIEDAQSSISGGNTPLKLSKLEISGMSAAASQPSPFTPMTPKSNDESSHNDDPSLDGSGSERKSIDSVDNSDNDSKDVPDNGQDMGSKVNVSDSHATLTQDQVQQEGSSLDVVVRGGSGGGTGGQGGLYGGGGAGIGGSGTGGNKHDGNGLTISHPRG
jgi:hypothetical protein